MTIDEIEINVGHVNVNKSTICTVDQFCQTVAQHTASGLDNEPIPDGVRWIARDGSHNKTVYIVELQPELRCVKWRGKVRTIATPYIVLKVPILWHMYTYAAYPYVELFYRNQPLQSIDDPLYHSNLLNVGITGQYTDWFCMGSGSYAKTHTEILEYVINAISGGEFNGDIERGTGTASWHKRYQQHQCPDPRVNDIDRWEQESKKDPDFVLGVDWMPADATPRSLLHRELGIGTYMAQISENTLANAILKA